MIHALLFENCRNVTVRGLDIDFTLPCWFQARVMEADRAAGTIRMLVEKGVIPRERIDESWRRILRLKERLYKGQKSRSSEFQ